MRCADCVRNAPNNYSGGYCLLLRRAVTEDWFCADFEPKKTPADKLRDMADAILRQCDLPQKLGICCSENEDCGDCMARCVRKIADEIDKERR